MCKGAASLPDQLVQLAVADMVTGRPDDGFEPRLARSQCPLLNAGPRGAVNDVCTALREGSRRLLDHVEHLDGVLGVRQGQPESAEPSLQPLLRRQQPHCRGGVLEARPDQRDVGRRVQDSGVHQQGCGERAGGRPRGSSWSSPCATNAGSQSLGHPRQAHCPAEPPQAVSMCARTTRRSAEQVVVPLRLVLVHGDSRKGR